MHRITLTPGHCSHPKHSTVPSLYWILLSETWFKFYTVSTWNFQALPTSKWHFHFWPDRPNDMKKVPYDANNPPLTRFTSVFIFSLNLYQLLNQFSSLSRIVRMTLASFQWTNCNCSLIASSQNSFWSTPNLGMHCTRLPSKDCLASPGLHLKKNMKCWILCI